MDSISDLIQNSSPKKPPQIERLINYVKEEYGENAEALVANTHYTLVVSNSSFAGRLRLDSVRISKMCELDKKLTIRIRHTQ